MPLMALVISILRLSISPRPAADTAEAMSEVLTEPNRRPPSPALTVSLTVVA